MLWDVSIQHWDEFADKLKTAYIYLQRQFYHKHIMKKNFIYYSMVLCSALGIATTNAQDLIEDHEGNVYEVATMADGRKWMLESLRVKTDLEGNPIQYYANTHNGLQTEEEAGVRYGYAYTVETLFGLSEVYSKHPDFPARARGLCPEGYYVPTNWPDENLAHEGDWQKLIRSYNGTPTWWSETANWNDMINALRISVGDGVGIENSSGNGDPGKFTIAPDGTVTVSGWSHWHASGPVEHDRTLGLNLATDKPGNTAAGYEYLSADRAAYCRCVENRKVSVSFEDFSDLSVTVRLTDSLEWNSYDSREEYTRICKENFKVTEKDGAEIEIYDIAISADAKTFQLFADFDTEKAYELTFLDARLADKDIKMGGYTFNNNEPLIFGKSDTGLQVKKYIQNVYVSDNKLNILSEKDFEACVYNVLGTEIARFPVASGHTLFDLSGCPSGVLLIRLFEPDSMESFTCKVRK